MKKLLLIGISHKTAPVERRERLFVPEERLPAFLEGLRRSPGVSEAVALSTCNRVEVYAVVDEAAGDGGAVRRALSDLQGHPLRDEHFYGLEDEDAVRHLLRVASGLESLVIGESEILGQVKRAYELARQAGATGKLTNVLFQRAMYVGKMVRTQTGISEGPSSVASLAVALAQRIFGDLAQSRVLIVGAGKMAELSARSLLSQKALSLTVVNRTFSKAQELAERFQAKAAPFERLLEEVALADVVICSTGSPEPLLRHDAVAEVLKERRGRSLFFIDIAVPRDVEPSVHKLENVYLYNIDDLESLVAESLGRRQGNIRKAGTLADEKAREFSPWYRAWRQGESASLRHAAPETNDASLFAAPEASLE